MPVESKPGWVPDCVTTLFEFADRHALEHKIFTATFFMKQEDGEGGVVNQFECANVPPFKDKETIVAFLGTAIAYFTNAKADLEQEMALGQPIVEAGRA